MKLIFIVAVVVRCVRRVPFHRSTKGTKSHEGHNEVFNVGNSASPLKAETEIIYVLIEPSALFQVFAAAEQFYSPRLVFQLHLSDNA